MAVAETLGQLQKLNADNAIQASEEAQQVFSVARISLLVTLAVCVVLAALLGVGITRAVTGPARHAVRAARAIAEGDLTTEVPAGGKDEMGQLLTALADMRDNLARVVTGVRSNAERCIGQLADRLEQHRQPERSRTEQQASALVLAASMEELGSTVRQNADNARTANNSP